MSKTIRNYKGETYHDGDVWNTEKDNKPRKQFVYRGDGWSTKSRGGVGNKRAWKSYMPLWYYKKNKAS